MFTDTEDKIVAKLKAALPAGTHVGVLDDLERVPEQRQKAPAAWVVYDGYTITNRVENVPHLVQLRLDWYVVIVAKSAKGSGDIKAAKTAAGALALTALQALTGLDLGGGKYLQVEEAPGPEYDGGYCHLPLAFFNAASLKGQV